MPLLMVMLLLLAHQVEIEISLLVAIEVVAIMIGSMPQMGLSVGRPVQNDRPRHGPIQILKVGTSNLNMSRASYWWGEFEVLKKNTKVDKILAFDMKNPAAEP
jgi:hypothetical protein